MEAKAIQVIEEVLKVSGDEIKDIVPMKEGMTNDSFRFECRGKQYIMRISGAGSDKLLNRKNEVAVYEMIAGKGICDDVIYINSETGYKIANYVEDARNCDVNNADDVKICMGVLNRLHEMKLKVSHEFNLWREIKRYEDLRGDVPSIHEDYAETKENVLKLKAYVDRNVAEKVLTHIDAVSANFMFSPDGNGGERVQLIDWEYAGMQDPHVDIAMFSMYAEYSREQFDDLMKIYFKGECDDATRIKLYCYKAICGFMWSGWCEFKRTMGVEFEEYELRHYNYAKDYYKLAIDELQKIGGEL